MPSVDVVIPSFQYGCYLRQCVESVLSQGVDTIRILIVDNASKDNSVELAQQLTTEDNRIDLRKHAKNLGLHASVNEGIDWADCDYFMVLCADDFLPPYALARAIAVMERHPEVSFAYGPYAQLRGQVCEDPQDQTLDAVWTIIKGPDYIRQSCPSIAATMAPLVRTSAQKKAGYYRPSLEYAADMELMLRLACYGDIAVTNTIQAVQRIHESNLSQATWRDPFLQISQRLAIFESFFENEGKQLPEGESLHLNARRRIAEDVYWKAIKYAFRGYPYTSFHLFKRAVELSPRIALIPPIYTLAQSANPFRRIVNALLH